MKRHRVAAVAYQGLCTFEFGCAVEVFALPRPELQVPWYDFAVCAPEPGALRAMGGIVVEAPHGLELLDQADTIVVPGWRDVHEEPPAALTRHLRAAHRRGARLCSICSGVFVLAAAGVLDGRRATTHWRYTELLAGRYPGIEVVPDVLYVDEGDILTSAGSAAGLDLLIHLVRKDHGAAVANLVARRLVIPPHRQGSQPQRTVQPVSSDERSRLARLQEWLRTSLDQPLSIASLAERVAMSPRTLQRQFKAATGESASAWLLRERIREARRLIEETSLPLAIIAARVGIASPETFRHHFRRQVGMSPSQYRALQPARVATSRRTG